MNERIRSHFSDDTNSQVWDVELIESAQPRAFESIGIVDRKREKFQNRTDRHIDANRVEIALGIDSSHVLEDDAEDFQMHAAALPQH